jgi:hypothetical protein
MGVGVLIWGLLFWVGELCIEARAHAWCTLYGYPRFEDTGWIQPCRIDIGLVMLIQKPRHVGLTCCKGKKIDDA